MPDKQTPWGPRPTDWELLPWRSVAKRSGTPIVVDGHNGVQQVTVRVRHRGVVERRIDANRRREIQSPNQVQVRTGQFIISKIDARNGACGFVPAALDGALVTTDFPVYDVSADAADWRYLDHLVALPVFWHLCESVSDGTTNRVRLNLDQFDALPFPIPPLGEQRRIAEVLDSIDAAIEKTEAVIEATERLRAALLAELLTRGVPGWHTEWKDVPGIGTIPACWDVVRLGDVAEVQTGRQVGKAPTNGVPVILPYLSVANVKDGYLHLESVKTMEVGASEVARFSLRAGDVLFTEGGDADKLGRGCVWNGEIAPCLHQNHIFAVRPHPARLSSGSLAAYARSPRGKAYFMGCAKQTTNLASINSSQLRAMPLPLPPQAEQQAIMDMNGSLRDRFAIESRILDAIRASKSTVAAALLSGRVRVRAAVEAPNG